MSPGSERGYVIVRPDDGCDNDADSRLPGEFRRLTEELGGDQLAVTLIRITAHSDFEQSRGQHRGEIEEIYFVTRGTLTLRFCDEIETVPAPAAVRISPGTASSHRNEGDNDVELWAISRHLGRSKPSRAGSGTRVRQAPERKPNALATLSAWPGELNTRHADKTELPARASSKQRLSA